MTVKALFSHISVRRWLLLLLLFLMLLPAALADQVRDIASECKIKVTENQDTRRFLLSNDYKQRWEGGAAGYIEVSLPAHETCQGIMVKHFGQETALEVFDVHGRRIGYGPGKYRIEYIPFDREADAFTVKRENSGDPLTIAQFCVLTSGELPNWVQRWQTLDDPADLMLVSTHPDDEILWFGGILPYYAGVQDYKVMVVYMVGGRHPQRTLELLDGLWRMGVKWYPDIGTFPDVGKHSDGVIYEEWGRNAALERVVSAIRRYQPQVVITQDINGEYGHRAHYVTVQAVIEAVQGLAGDSAFHTEMFEDYAPWSPLKLYIHLWKQNVIVFDWNQPLEAFGGETALEVAKAAFKMHVSQQTGKYSVRDRGQYDCSRFGLYWTSVGLDERCDDLFEHVQLRGERWGEQLEEPQDERQDGQNDDSAFVWAPVSAPENGK